MSNFNWQPSGRPWNLEAEILAGATAHLEFPFVTNELLITNRDTADLIVYFADPATTDCVAEGYGFSLTQLRDTFAMRVSVKEIWIVNTNGAAAGAYSVSAELGELASAKLPTLTGVGIGEEV